MLQTLLMLASTPFTTAVMPPIINTVLQLMLANIYFWFRQPVSTEAMAPIAAHIYIRKDQNKGHIKTRCLWGCCTEGF